MKKVLVSFLVMIFACAAVFAEFTNDTVKVIGKVESGAGDPEGGIKVNGISLEFAIKGIVGSDPEAPSSWKDTNDTTANWELFKKDANPSVYVDLTGNVDTINVDTIDDGESSHTAFDSFYICFRALGNNLDKEKVVSVSFSSDGLRKTDSEDYSVTLEFDLGVNIPSPPSAIKFEDGTNAIKVTHPGQDLRNANAYGGYAHVTWDQKTDYSAGEYEGQITIRIDSV